MKYFLITLLAFVSLSHEAAHGNASTDRRQALTFEIFGKSMFWSIDYDISLTQYWGLGTGISVISGPFNTSAVFIPVFTNFYFSPKDKRLIFSAGFDYTTGAVNMGGWSTAGAGLLPFFGAGYEFRNQKGFVFRGMGFLTYFKSITGNSFFILAPSLALGYSF